MSLSDLASLGSFVSGVAVLISLVYLALQVRQAEKNQRALIQQGRADRMADHALRLATPPLGPLQTKGTVRPEELSAAEIDQYLQINRAYFLDAEDSFLQHKAGLLDEAAYGSFVTGWRIMAGLPGFAAAWRMTSRLYGREFATLMDELTRQASPTFSDDQKVELWQAVLRDVRSREWKPEIAAEIAAHQGRAG